jgi:hypothetical protein
MRLKHWPATGRAQWNRRRRPDPRAQAWQRLIKPAPRDPRPAIPCPHQDTFGRTWVVSSRAEYRGHPGPARVCVQCGANVSDKPRNPPQ